MFNQSMRVGYEIYVEFQVFPQELPPGFLSGSRLRHVLRHFAVRTSRWLPLDVSLIDLAVVHHRRLDVLVASPSLYNAVRITGFGPIINSNRSGEASDVQMT